MITLKNINLSSIDLSGIDLRGIKLGLGGRGGGSGDGFPVLPGDITRWHFGGLTNEMMSAMDDPRIEDADHKGRFLSFKNFAWSGMSGVGGYNQNFNQYAGLSGFDKTVNDSSIKVFIPQDNNSTSFYDSKSREIGYTYNFYIKVTGIENRELRVLNGTEGGTALSIKQDGVYLINAIVADDWGQNRLYFSFPKAYSNNTIIIEQLPLYPGALVFDGVDDYGICDNFPILTKEKGYTVVALRQWITYNQNAIFAIATNASDQSFNGAFTFEYLQKGLERTISYGSTQISLSYSKSPFSWQTTSKYNGVDINNGNKEATNLLALGRAYPQRNESANFAIWELVFLDHDATEEELTKIKDYFVKTYPWLFPDQAWTVTGKTNEDEDRATIANITGNGNDLVLSNFGFAEGSGYNEEGEYAGYLVTDGVDDRVQDSSFKLNKDWTLVGEWVFLNQKATNAGITKPFSFVVYNRTTGLSLFINTGTSGITIENVKSIKAICSDGRIYLDDWSEMLISKDQDITSSTSVLSIGFNGTAYTQMAFKNLGIYNNQLLSKDDCIKAYNYLQTLKAK